MKTKEQWIEETLGSLDGIRRAESPEGFQPIVMAGLKENPSRRILFTTANIWKVAAGLALLISMNIVSIHYCTTTGEVQSKPAETIASDYFTYIETIKL